MPWDLVPPGSWRWMLGGMQKGGMRSGVSTCGQAWGPRGAPLQLDFCKSHICNLEGQGTLWGYPQSCPRVHQGSPKINDEGNPQNRYMPVEGLGFGLRLRSRLLQCSR